MAFAVPSILAHNQIGAPGRNRTCDARFRKPTLYPLSYGGSRWANHSAGADLIEFTQDPETTLETR